MLLTQEIIHLIPLKHSKLLQSKAHSLIKSNVKN